MKKWIIYGIVLAFSVLGALCAWQFVVHHNVRQHLLSPVNVSLYQSDSATYNLMRLADTRRPTIIFYFHPECEFCEAEIDELIKNKDLLSSVNAVFVTFCPIDETMAFIKEHPIDSLPNYLLLFDPNDVFADLYQITTSPPFTLVYDNKMQLVKYNKGMITISMLKKYLCLIAN